MLPVVTRAMRQRGSYPALVILRGLVGPNGVNNSDDVQTGNLRLIVFDGSSGVGGTVS